jgi:tetratricopeptide (TPR) repeat protein
VCSSDLSNAVYVLWRYLLLMLVPYPLSADYSFDSIPVLSAFSLRNVSSGLILAAGAWGLWRWSRRQAGVAFAAGFFALTFLPVSNFLIPVGAIMAERFVYMPSAGFCLLLAAALSKIERRVALTLLTALLATYAGFSIARNRDWKNDAAIFTRILETSPRSVRGMVNAGQAMLDAGRFEEARDLNLAAIALAPLPASPLRAEGGPAAKYSLPYSNLGIAYMRMGDLPRAEAALQDALKREPDDLDAWVNIGIIFAKQTRFDGAIAAFSRAIALLDDPAATPNACKLFYNLGLAMRQKGEYLAVHGGQGEAKNLFREAAGNFRTALQINPGYEEARRGLERCLSLIR